MNQDCPMTIIGYLDTLIKKAMKDGDKDMLSIYRIAKTEMIKYQKDKAAGRDTSTQEKQLEWVVSELPKPVSEEDIRLDLQSWLSEQPEHCKNIGFVMQHLKLMFHGRDLDGKLASSIAKEMLGK